jgi:two-component system chemotaxis response regulator CheB
MKERIIVIGASFNGIAALSELMKALPSDLPAAILVVQHIAPSSLGFLPGILSRAGKLPAVHARDQQVIEAGVIYVAPPDRHMVVRLGGTIGLSHGPKENRFRPAVDVTFRSAALVFGAAVVGVVLTGYLDDGTAGLLAIKDRGGIAIVQEPREAAAPSMPASALHHVDVDHRASIGEIARLIVQFANDPPGAPAAVPQLLEIEGHIAEGTLRLAEWQSLERLARPSGLNCPDCRSALYEIDDGRLLRFRCRAGHAFSSLSLLDGQVEAREELRSFLFGALMEEATFARRLLEMGEDPVLLHHLRERASCLEGHAANLCDWLGTPSLGDHGT